MQKLRILFLCPQPLWPTNTGARLRNFHLANALAASCQVSILQITHPGDVKATERSGSFQKVISAARGKSYTPSNIVRGLVGPDPVTVLNYTSDNVARALAQALETDPVDAVQMESIHLFRYLEIIRQLKKPPIVVLDWHNIESELMYRYGQSTSNYPRKLMAIRTAGQLSRLEDKALQTFAAHTVVSEREMEKLLRRVPGARIHVIPNGVDTAAFQNHSRNEDRRTLLFVGSMDYHANADAVVWFSQDVWPKLAEQFPTLMFEIVGRDPLPSVRALASDRIIVTGTVDDVRPYYRKAFALIAPLRVGGGTRLKILEAMAAGVPVISTRLGAEGLAVVDHENIMLADDARTIAAAIRELQTDSDLEHRLCQNAQDLVKAEYDWSVLGERLLAVYASLLRS